MGGVKASVCGESGRQDITRRCLPERLVVRDVEVMKLRAVVVADEPGHLLKMFRLEFNDRGGAEAMRLLPARDERLPEQAADRFAAKEPQIAGARGEAENFLRPRRAQPLEIDRQLRLD